MMASRTVFYFERHWCPKLIGEGFTIPWSEVRAMLILAIPGQVRVLYLYHLSFVLNLRNRSFFSASQFDTERRVLRSPPGRSLSQRYRSPEHDFCQHHLCLQHLPRAVSSTKCLGFDPRYTIAPSRRPHGRRKGNEEARENGLKMRRFQRRAYETWNQGNIEKATGVSTCPN